MLAGWVRVLPLMLKFLLLLGVLWLVWRLFLAPPRARRASPSTVQTMRACAHCGVHQPESECLRDAAGAFFCSPEHRTAGRRQP
jgi:uncharacterized protein